MPGRRVQACHAKIRYITYCKALDKELVPRHFQTSKYYNRVRNSPKSLDSASVALENITGIPTSNNRDSVNCRSLQAFNRTELLEHYFSSLQAYLARKRDTGGSRDP